MEECEKNIRFISTGLSETQDSAERYYTRDPSSNHQSYWSVLGEINTETVKKN